MTLNEAHDTYSKNPSEENKDVLGVELLGYCKAKVYQLIKSRDQDYLDDLIAESVCGIWSRIDDYKRDKSAFATWAGMIVETRVADVNRDAVRRKEMPLLEADRTTPGGLNKLEAKLTLNKLIDLLPEKDKVFILNHLEAERSGSLQNPDEVYRKRLSRAIKKLKELGHK